MIEFINKYSKVLVVSFVFIIMIAVVVSTASSLAEENNSNQIYTRDELSSIVAKLSEDNITIKTGISELQNSTTNSNIFLKSYPVGSIYISTGNTNPGSIYGGTWTSFGSGKTIVGVDLAQSAFNTVEKTGGSSTVDFSHNHAFNWTGSHFHEIPLIVLFGDTGTYVGWADTHGYRSLAVGEVAPSDLFLAQAPKHYVDYKETKVGQSYYARSKAESLTISGTTAGNSNSIQSVMNPYITVYMWKRIA